MNVRWMRSNADLLAFLAIAMIAVVVLAVLVVRQQQNQAADDGQAFLEAAPAVGAPPRANPTDPANVLIKPGAPSHAAPDDSAAVVEPPGRAASGDQPVESDRPSPEVTDDSAAVVEPPGRAASGDQPIESDRPSPEVTNDSAAVVEPPARAKAPEFGDTPTHFERSAHSNRSPNPDAEETALTPGDHDDHQ
ncbi:MAG: hypothetical protein M3460_22860 [Actinomycetota bacterium]|nr:hypothetical protein [Actinomycetota bacterium]